MTIKPIARKAAELFPDGAATRNMLLDRDAAAFVEATSEVLTEFSDPVIRAVVKNCVEGNVLDYLATKKRADVTVDDVFAYAERWERAFMLANAGKAGARA